EVASASHNDGIFCVKLKDGQALTSAKCIIATGGLSYPTLGSTGDGLEFAKHFGHKVTKTNPSLVPLVCSDSWISDVMGLSLKDVNLTAHVRGRKVFDGAGEMLFTHFGISGPLVLSASAYLAGQNAAKISIDLKPNMSKDALGAAILNELNKNLNRDIKNALGEIIPKSLIPIVLQLTNIEPEKKANSITKDERGRIASIIKSLELNTTGNRGYKEAVVTAGGVATKEIDPSTMESKIIPGLYFAGEVIDIHALTGGYNLQIAFSTGYLAGASSAR
ncbi:MAG: aminoacetone oxidase family FAD-binding enzyme, partial [Defluviitaleaceae bacterium]|nr:aminoacetone oxidase family FAD-binding enzyme [Defluviitaleaceae bacterium]